MAKPPLPSSSAYDRIIGQHPTIEELRRLIRRVAASAARCVLIYGETGTGKGLVARAVHDLSPRRAAAFVDINCAAIPAHLLESELFGFERGAFTGAAAKKVGLVEAAHGGTLFLDEVRELDAILQAKVLTVLDGQRFRRIGSVQPTAVDVRFVAATNRILLREVSEGRFREDLYYRLQVVALNLPPLRERGEDVFILIDHFLAELSARYHRTISGVEPAVREIFARYRWPGNVRELENLIERVFILEDDATILVRHIPQRILREVEQGTPSAPPPSTIPPTPVPLPSPPTAVPADTLVGQDVPATSEALSFHAASDAFQADLIRRALAAAHGNITAAAERLGLSRHALRHQMGRLGLR